MDMSPFRATARLLLAGAASVALASCSSGDPATPPPPPPPGPKVTQVTLTPSSGTLQPGTTIQLTATAEDSAGATVYTAISWASSDTTIAVVSSTGMVTGRAVGQVQISATAATVTNSAQIKVAMATSIPAFDHVFVVFLENRDLADVIGNTGVWPYLNTLAHRYDYATEYRGATHPSIGNYFTATTGDTVTNDDLHSSTVSVDNLVRRLIAANKTWKSYAENLPSAGYIGGDNGLYWRYHNPFSYFSDVRNSATQRQNLVPFTQLSADLAAGTVPNFAFLLPNGCDDGHDCTDAPDKWLQANIEPLINSALF
jgi:hypothetical protein